jgi:hypothetical protein
LIGLLNDSSETQETRASGEIRQLIRVLRIRDRLFQAGLRSSDAQTLWEIDSVAMQSVRCDADSGMSISRKHPTWHHVRVADRKASEYSLSTRILETTAYSGGFPGQSGVVLDVSGGDDIFLVASRDPV